MIEYRKMPPVAREQITHLEWKAFIPDQAEPQPPQENPQEEAGMARFGAFDDGRLAAQVNIEDRQAIIRGVEMTFGGIGGVATLPEYRRERLVAGLFRICFEYMHQAGIIFSALAPFSFPFYEKFGYAHAAQMHAYRFTSRHLKPVRAPYGITFREFQPENDLEAVMAVQRSMVRFGSRVLETRRYLQDNHDKHRYVFERGGTLIGFIEYDFGTSDDGKEQMAAHHTWFSCDECLPALVDLTHRFGSQREWIAWEVDPEIPLEYYITEPGKARRTRDGYMMVRVVDFPEFCRRVRVPLFAAEPVIIRVADPDCPWNEGTWKLTPVSGRLEIETSGREPEISFDALHLSHALGGQLTANRLHRLGGLPCAADAAERFTRIFPPDSYVTYTGF